MRLKLSPQEHEILCYGLEMTEEDKNLGVVTE